ncbi:MAG: MBL fold metallo-hydrolase [Acidimicrobiia bacterium]
MNQRRIVTRRVALKDMGKAGLAVMVFGVTACSNDDSGSTTTTTARSVSTTEVEDVDTTLAVSTTAASPPSTEITSPSQFHRVELGGVAAYILYRGGEAALVDTGDPGSLAAIEAGLTSIGLDWSSVGHVIVTHEHRDHMGSLGEVVEAAPTAEVYAGLQDIPAMMGVAQPKPVGNNGRVFDLDIIATPGHTPGHISVLDRVAGVLVAGDALSNRGGELSGSPLPFTDDVTVANASVKTLAQLEYDVVLFGHGEPILSGGSDEVKRLASGLP